MEVSIGMTPFTESLKNTYERVIPFYKNEIKKISLKEKIFLFQLMETP